MPKTKKTDRNKERKKDRQMKVLNTWPFEGMTSGLTQTLETLRKRTPSASEFIELKAKALNAYMTDCGRDTAVVAVSGGIDSGLVLALCTYAASLPGSPIVKIVGISLPVFSKAATNQENARDRAKYVCDYFKSDYMLVPLETHVNALADAMEVALPTTDPWARGQLASYMRTPAIYYTTSLLTASGRRPVVVGTTNRDEGAYIGYFGKASDGMVDIQLISDMSKKLVREAAALLKVPTSVLEASPSGDMYDGRLDEDVFGAPYECVELDSELRYLGPIEEARLMETLSETDITVLKAFRSNIENMHKYNGHKYLGCSPAVHLDVCDVQFNGGWSYKTYAGKSVSCEQPEFGDHRRW
jgi:NAD+ synthase (glutamine-hydrolysing)